MNPRMSIGAVVCLGVVLLVVPLVTRPAAIHPHDDEEKLRDAITEFLNKADEALAATATSLQKSAAPAAADATGTRLRNSLDRTLGDLRSLRTTLNSGAADPKLEHDLTALRSFERAARELEKTSYAFRSLAKHSVDAITRKR